MSRIQIQDVCGMSVPEIVRRSEIHNLPDAEHTLRHMIYRSTKIQYGFIDGQLACMWGMITPTILSETCYFWLLTTDVVKEHTFLFIRGTQRYIEKMLERYPVITGEINVDDLSAQRWIKWLGAEYEMRYGERIKFVIRRK